MGGNKSRERVLSKPLIQEFRGGNLIIRYTARVSGRCCYGELTLGKRYYFPFLGRSPLRL